MMFRARALNLSVKLSSDMLPVMSLIYHRSSILSFLDSSRAPSPFLFVALYSIGEAKEHEHWEIYNTVSEARGVLPDISLRALIELRYVCVGP